MSLQKKIALILCVIWMGIIISIVLSSEVIVRKAFIELESQYAKRNIHRAQEVIQEKISTLVRLNLDWSPWDEAYEFMGSGDMKFIERNLPATVYKDTDTPLFSFWHNDGSLMYGKLYNNETAALGEIPKEFHQLMRPEKKLLQLDINSPGAHGIVKLPDQLWLFASHQILTTAKKGPIRGTLLMAKPIDANLIKFLSEVIKLKISVTPIDEIPTSRYIELMAGLKKDNGEFLEPKNEQVLIAHNILKDFFGNEIAVLSLETDRDFLRMGTTTIYYFIFSLIVAATLMSLLMWYLINKFVICRIQSISSQIASFDQHRNIEQRIHIEGKDELQDMTGVINTMLGVIESSHNLLEKRVLERTNEITIANSALHQEINQRTEIAEKLLKKERELEQLALFDSLTSLPNRVNFNQSLCDALKRSHQENKPGAVLFLDLDRFKYINDSLGHDVGDAVLVEVAMLLKIALPKNGYLGRMGGDEFIIFLYPCENGEADITAQNILDSLLKPIQIKDREFHISGSIGISTFPEDGTTLESIESSADLAMYQAKAVGGNAYYRYSNTLNSAISEKLYIEEKLRDAIANNQFILHYQPIMDVKTKQIVAVEALLRWHDPELGLVSPEKFIPIAEETGMIYKMGEWVLREACTKHMQWVSMGYTPIRMAVNVSALEFSEPYFVEQVQKLLRDLDMDPNYLEMEVTETILMTNIDVVIKKLNQLREMGIHIAVDDFGTGYSSMTYLKKFPINTLKIDKSFITEVSTDRNDMAITEAVILLGHNLNIDVLAEGVETTEQLEYLVRSGCDRLQGFLFSRPVSEDKLLRIVPLVERMIPDEASSIWPKYESHVDDAAQRETLTKSHRGFSV